MVGDHQLEVGVRLGQDRLHRLVDVLLVVERRHDDRDPRGHLPILTHARGCKVPNATPRISMIGPRVRRCRAVPAGAPRVGRGPGLPGRGAPRRPAGRPGPADPSGTTPGGLPFRVAEVLLVNDCGPDDSAGVMRRLEREHPWVRTIWLSRNFGQHAATLAGMASSGGDWIVTMDEDGQHDPADIPTLLDVAMCRAGLGGLRATDQRRTARSAAQHRVVRRQACGPGDERRRGRLDVPQLPADPRRGRPEPGGVRRIGRLSRRRPGLGHSVGRDRAGEAAVGGCGPPVGTTRCAACCRTSGGWSSPTARVA